MTYWENNDKLEEGWFFSTVENVEENTTFVINVTDDFKGNVSIKVGDEVELDYVKMVFTQSGNNYEADLDWKQIDAHSYYEAMRAGNRSVTGLATTLEFETKFKKYLDQGLDILYISCSSKLSGSISSLYASKFSITKSRYQPSSSSSNIP